jgi:hypothetical protein
MVMEEHRLRVFRNCAKESVSFLSKRDKIVGCWRKLHTEELHNLYSSPNSTRQIKSWRMRWAGLAAQVGEVCI